MTFAILPPGATVFLDLSTLLYYAYFLSLTVPREELRSSAKPSLPPFSSLPPTLSITVAVAGPGDLERARSAPESPPRTLLRSLLHFRRHHVDGPFSGEGDWITTPSTLFSGSREPEPLKSLPK